jgi:hypothetical protein
MKLFSGKRAVMVLLVMTLWVAPASATLFTGSSGSLAASADFSLVGDTLTIVLTNTSTADVAAPADVLTGVFFNMTSGTLTPVSASLNGSTAFYAAIVNNVGEGWSYGSGFDPLITHGMTSGISVAGLGVFAQANFFSPPVTPLDGIDYGLLSLGDNSATGNGGITSGGPLIKDSVKFTLTAPAGFSLAELGTSVVFQYGTALTEPNFPGDNGTVPPPVPVPPTVWLMGSGMVGLALLGWRRRKQ